MARQLTSKQNNFIDGVVDGLSYSQAYREAYDAKNMSIESIASQGYKLANLPHIAPIIALRKKELANKAIWDREQSLKMLRDIAVEAKENIIIADSDSDKTFYNAAASSAAIKAIEQANKMCGYNEPEKSIIDNNITITISGGLEDYAD